MINARTLAGPAVFSLWRRLHASGGLLSALVAILLLAMVLAGAGPTLLRFNAYVIMTSSMQPAIWAGSIAVTRLAPLDAIGVGDVITFRRAGLPGTNVTHRVVAVNYEGGYPVFITKGDNNHQADSEPVRFRGEVDRLVYAVPLAGYVVSFANSRAGVVLFLLVAPLGLAATEWLHRRRRQAPPPSPVLAGEQTAEEELRAVKESLRRMEGDYRRVSALVGMALGFEETLIDRDAEDSPDNARAAQGADNAGRLSRVAARRAASGAIGTAPAEEQQAC